MNDTASEPGSTWWSMLLLVFGVLIIVYAYLAMRNDVPIVLWGLGWVVGPLFVLIGGGAIVRLLMRR